MSKVSIIVPGYNAGPYIREAVESALGQTHPDCEVIVVNDGSTDNTEDVLAPYRDRIVYIFEDNKGLAGARNTALKRASGDYVAFLDADDIFLPEKMAEQIAVLEAQPDYEVCYCDILHFSDTEPRHFYHHRYRYPSGDIFAPLLRKQFINPLTILARRSLFDRLGLFDETLRRSEDWDLWLRWAHGGVKFYYLDKPLAYYRVRMSGNLSSLQSEPEMKEKNLYLFTRLGEIMTRDEWARYRYEKVLIRLKVKLVFAYLMVGDKKAALRRAIGLPPLWRFLVVLLPGSVWKWVLGTLRQMKHRSLLQPVEETAALSKQGN